MIEVTGYNELPEDYWDFIEKHLPYYSSDNDVLKTDILCRYINDEEVWEEDYEWLPKTKEEAQEWLEELEIELYNEAVRAFNKEHYEFRG